MRIQAPARLDDGGIHLAVGARFQDWLGRGWARPERDHQAGDEIGEWRDAIAAEHQHVEERRLECDSGEALVAERQPLNRAGLARELTPVGSELKVMTMPDTTPSQKW